VIPPFKVVFVTALFKKISPPSSPDWYNILNVDPSNVKFASPLKGVAVPVAVTR
jgi:hypothetical protein